MLSRHPSCSAVCVVRSVIYSNSFILCDTDSFYIDSPLFTLTFLFPSPSPLFPHSSSSFISSILYSALLPLSSLLFLRPHFPSTPVTIPLYRGSDRDRPSSPDSVQVSVSPLVLTERVRTPYAREGLGGNVNEYTAT